MVKILIQNGYFYPSKLMFSPDKDLASITMLLINS